MPLVEIRDLGRSFDGIQALDHFSCGIARNEILGLFGPNGAGKTTLFNIMTGFVTPDRGSIVFKGIPLCGLQPHVISNYGIARTFQELRLIRRLTVLENVLLFCRKQPGERLRNVFFRPNSCAKHETEIQARAVGLLASWGLEDKAGALADDLSYGQQKLLSLVCCLAAEPDLVLIDEPVAGIAPEMIERVLEMIAALPGEGRTVVVIEHNVDALKRLCHRLVFMDAGRSICEGTPEQVLNDPRVIEAYLE